MMAKKSDTSSLPFAGRQIIGFSLPRALAGEVKVEAAWRNVSSKDLLLESWTFCKNSSKKRL
jgi:hypothetical protein